MTTMRTSRNLVQRTRTEGPGDGPARPDERDPTRSQPVRSPVGDRFVGSSATSSERQTLRTRAGRAAASNAGASGTALSQPLRGQVRRGLVAAHQKSGPNEGAAPGYQGNPRTELGDAAKILKEHVLTLDAAAGGRKDGKFGLADLQAVAADPNQPATLRNAAQTLLADPNKLNALDVAGGPRLDRTFSLKDLDAVVQESEQNAGGMTLGQVAERLGRKAGLEQKGREDWSHFDALDAAKTGARDGKISREDCRIVAADPNASPELKEVARALLDNDNLFHALDVAHADRRDGKFSLDDVKNVKYSPTPEAGRQWGAADEKALDEVLRNDGPFPDLYRGVHQTDRGNCASTAVIKAAIDTWGTDVFRSVEKLPRGGYAVEMKDGARVQLSREELEAAATGAHYQGNEPGTRAFANLCYAAMAKRAQMLGHEGSDTYAEALRSLANGERTSEVPRYLGLADKVKNIDVDRIKDHDGVVAWGNGHAVFVDERNGAHFTDAWGQARTFDGTNEVNKPNNALQYAFYFAD